MGLGQGRVPAGTGRNGGRVTCTLVASLVDFAGNAEVTALSSTACFHVSCLASAALLVPQPRMSPGLYPHHQDRRRLGLWGKRGRETRVRRTGLCGHPCGQLPLLRVGRVPADTSQRRSPPGGGKVTAPQPAGHSRLSRGFPAGSSAGRSVSGAFCSAEEMAAD